MGCFVWWHLVSSFNRPLNASWLNSPEHRCGMYPDSFPVEAERLVGTAVKGLLPLGSVCDSLSFVNTQFVPVRIHDYGRSTAGHFYRLERKWHLVSPKVCYRFFKVLDFKGELSAIAGWFQEGFFSNRQGVRPHLIFHPESTLQVHGGCAGQAQYVFIKCAGTRLIGGWIDNKGKFVDFNRCYGFRVPGWLIELQKSTEGRKTPVG